jgi:hypothetical protein
MCQCKISIVIITGFWLQHHQLTPFDQLTFILIWSFTYDLVTEHCWAHWAIVATSKESTLQCRCQELSIQSSDYWFLHVWESQWEFRPDITTLLIAFSAVSEGSFMYNVLILIHDLSVCHLTSHQSLEHIKQYFLYIDNLVSIKRSTASVLIQNQAENCTSWSLWCWLIMSRLWM